MTEPTTEPTPAKPKSNYFLAAVAAAVGAYFFAVGARLLPIPGGPANLHGPLWLILCAGLAFFLAGLAIAIQTLGHANAGGELPAEAPRWMRVAQYLIALAIFVCFGAIGSWIAFGPGERQFSGTFMFGDPATNAIIGRAVFGVGAIMIWLCTAAMVAFGIRKFFNNQEKSRADNCA
jgi:hypothetical protein